MVGDVIKQVLDSFKDDEITGLWMTSEEGVEEKREERDVKREVEKRGKEFKIWKDESVQAVWPNREMRLTPGQKILRG